MRRGRALLGGLAVAAALATTAAWAPPAPAGGAPAIELVEQSPIPDPRATVTVAVRLPGIPDDGNLSVTVRGRVRSRSELAASMAGETLRSSVFQTVVPLGTLPPSSDGVRTFSLPLDPAQGGPPLNAGVYPLELVARDATNGELAQLVTHLVVPPAVEGSPPLAVVPLAEVAAPPVPRVITPSGELDPDAVAALAELVRSVAAVERATTSLVIGPETLDALAVSGDLGATAVATLRELAAVQPVVAQPYVDISLDAMLEAGLGDEISRQIAAGALRVERVLGTPARADTWIAQPDLGADGLALLEAAGVAHTVVPAALVEPLPEGVLSLSLAQPFLLDPPRAERAEGSGTIDALEIDPAVTARLDAEDTPALLANRTIAELATLWFEQPGIHRAAVVPLGPDLAPGAAEQVLEGLAASPVFATTSLDEAFAGAAPLLDPADNRVHRALTPTPSTAFSGAAAGAVRDTRASLESAGGMVGPTSPLLPVAGAQLLLATADQLEPTVRNAEAEAVRASVGSLEASVTGPVSYTLTLTAREGTIPLTLHNDSGLPLDVVIHLRSTKLDFPDGTDMPVVLEEQVTRFDIPVRTRASGAVRLDITVTSPDGRTELVRSRYTVRSTAVAGAGLLLSIGAGLFLLVWWARHWRNTRRNARLVAAHTHPTTPGEPRG